MGLELDGLAVVDQLDVGRVADDNLERRLAAQGALATGRTERRYEGTAGTVAHFEPRLFLHAQDKTVRARRQRRRCRDFRLRLDRRRGFGKRSLRLFACSRLL